MNLEEIVRIVMGFIIAFLASLIIIMLCGFKKEDHSEREEDN